MYMYLIDQVAELRFVNRLIYAIKQIYTHTLSRQSSCPEATAIHILDIPGLVFVFRQNGAPAHRARDTVAFRERKVFDSTMWPTNLLDLNPVDYIYSICSVLQKKLHPSRIANVDEVKTRLIDKWEHFHQSIVDAANDQWRHWLSACVRVCGAHFEH